MYHESYSRQRWPYGTLLACAAVLTMGGCGISALTSAPSEVSAKVDELFATMKAGTFADSYESVTTPEFRKVIDKAAYQKLGEVVSTRLGRLKSKKTGGINMRIMNGVASADANYPAEFEKGSGTITVRMKKVGSDWKLLLLRVDSPILLQDMATTACSACGAGYAASAKFCPGCGRKLDEKAPTEENDDKPIEPANASGTPI